MDLRELGWEGVDWVHLAQDMDSGGTFWTRYWTFGFHKMRRISWPAKWLLHFQERSLPWS